jgi:hypothetical protein
MYWRGLFNLGYIIFTTFCRVWEVLERIGYPGTYKLRYLLQGAGGIGEDRLPWDLQASLPGQVETGTSKRGRRLGFIF